MGHCVITLISPLYRIGSTKLSQMKAIYIPHSKCKISKQKNFLNCTILTIYNFYIPLLFFDSHLQGRQLSFETFPSFQFGIWQEKYVDENDVLVPHNYKNGAFVIKQIVCKLAKFLGIVDAYSMANCSNIIYKIEPTNCLLKQFNLFKSEKHKSLFCFKSKHWSKV